MRAKLDGFQRLEVHDLAAKGYTHRSIAAAYGVSDSTISRVLGPKSRIGRPPKLAPCAICGAAKTLRFNLHRGDGVTRTTRGAGAISLCEPCWRRVAAPWRRPRKKRLTTRTVLG